MPVFIGQAQHIEWISQLHYALIEIPRIRRTPGANHDSWRSSKSREPRTRGHREAQPGQWPHAEAVADRCSSAVSVASPSSPGGGGEGDIIIATLQNTARRAHVGCGQSTALRRYPCPTACSRGVAVSPVRKTS
eukprot:scaffold3905_cov122-Isochrysis_galbana.AAC.5